MTIHKILALWRPTNILKSAFFCAYITLVGACFAAPCALFKAYPELTKAVPRLELANLPTPVVHMQKLGHELGHAALYLKRDDLTGAVRGDGHLLGGNKVRKLEFLLADARAHGCSRVITIGAAGSNHAAATAAYARAFGLDVDLVLTGQFESPMVRRNLLLDVYYGATLHRHEDGPVSDTVERLRQQFCESDEREPYVIPADGSTPLGALGYVSAAFELKQQIDAGLMPKPDRIYVALGSAGTAAGLIVGLRAAGLPCTVVAVSVQASMTIGKRLLTLVSETNAFVHTLAPRFPLFDWTERDFIVDVDCYAGGYGVPSEDGVAMAKLLRRTEELKLEQTYTAKAFVAFVRDAHVYQDKTLLFWHTFSAGSFEKETLSIVGQHDPRLAAFAHYFAPPPILKAVV